MGLLVFKFACFMLVVVKIGGQSSGCSQQFKLYYNCLTNSSNSTRESAGDLDKEGFVYEIMDCIERCTENLTFYEETEEYHKEQSQILQKHNDQESCIRTVFSMAQPSITKCVQQSNSSFRDFQISPQSSYISKPTFKCSIRSTKHILDQIDKFTSCSKDETKKCVKKVFKTCDSFAQLEKMETKIKSYLSGREICINSLSSTCQSLLPTLKRSISDCLAAESMNENVAGALRKCANVASEFVVTNLLSTLISKSDDLADGIERRAKALAKGLPIDRFANQDNIFDVKRKINDLTASIPSNISEMLNNFLSGHQVSGVAQNMSEFVRNFVNEHHLELNLTGLSDKIANMSGMMSNISGLMQSLLPFTSNLRNSSSLLPDLLKSFNASNFTLNNLFANTVAQLPGLDKSRVNGYVETGRQRGTGIPYQEATTVEYADYP